jgi:hydrogenase maturation protein HypF
MVSMAGIKEIVNSYHIHISGRVQGVGFRPFVARIAESLHIPGCVSNSTDGVHIAFNAPKGAAEEFYNMIIQQPPVHALITHHHMRPAPLFPFKTFTILPGTAASATSLLLTPDIALCDTCRQELSTVTDRRYQYAFTTCLNCGPRYSIMKALPYDRVHTSMAHLELCSTCAKEYKTSDDRRFHSETNSCPECGVPMHGPALEELDACLHKGGIVAVKGVGGYLLLCDVNQAAALRKKKNRPQKPFAVMYPSIDRAQEDVYISQQEAAALSGPVSPVVLCRLRKPANEVAPGLNRLGVLLPYSPLLQLIATKYGRPLIATSGNKSGVPIIYQDDAAQGIADLVLSFDREIIFPQDDSVVCYTATGQRIIMRGGRGLAPVYLHQPSRDGVLAMGAELKSTFAITGDNYWLSSQYLGSHGTLEAEVRFEETLEKLLQLLHKRPVQILTDMHPGYFVSRLGERMAEMSGATLMQVQHHKAHFGAVLAENNLLQQRHPVLGIIWDGAGYGEDGKTWGGEVFVYEDSTMKRVGHLDYFPQLMGDKMNKEPRLSALALLQNFPGRHAIVKQYFTEPEWRYYHKLLSGHCEEQTSSMGRLLDGIAAILGITGVSTFEGEAVMKMEAMATTAMTHTYYEMPFDGEVIQWRPLVIGVLDDVERGMDKGMIAYKVYYSLVQLVNWLKRYYRLDDVAFSGGVFQSTLLTGMLSGYFHRELSPNDECIAAGQLACFSIQNN